MHGKDTWRIQFSLCLRKKWTNFDSHRMVCELFADGTAQVRSPVHTYAHLVWEPFTSGSRTIRRASVYENLHVCTQFKGHIVRKNSPSSGVIRPHQQFLAISEPLALLQYI